MSQEFSVPPRGTEFRCPDPEWKPGMAAGSPTPAFRTGEHSGLNGILLVQYKRLRQKKKYIWWQPFVKTTNIDNCWLPHRDTQEMSLAYRHVYTAAHTHSYTGGGGREKIKMKAKKKRRRRRRGEGVERITYKDQGQVERSEGPPCRKGRDTLKL